MTLIAKIINTLNQTESAVRLDNRLHHLLTSAYLQREEIAIRQLFDIPENQRAMFKHTWGNRLNDAGKKALEKIFATYLKQFLQQKKKYDFHAIKSFVIINGFGLSESALHAALQKLKMGKELHHYLMMLRLLQTSQYQLPEQLLPYFNINHKSKPHEIGIAFSLLNFKEQFTCSQRFNLLLSIIDIVLEKGYQKEQLTDYSSINIKLFIIELVKSARISNHAENQRYWNVLSQTLNQADDRYHWLIAIIIDAIHPHLETIGNILLTELFSKMFASKATERTF